MSDMSYDLGRVTDSSLENDEINQNKVEKIRDAWKNGDYKPDSKLIAGHLVEWLKKRIILLFLALLKGADDNFWWVRAQILGFAPFLFFFKKKLKFCISSVDNQDVGKI